jgi:hypothetical protein
LDEEGLIQRRKYSRCCGDIEWSFIDKLKESRLRMPRFEKDPVYPGNLPDDLKQLAVPLDIIGMAEVAWKYPDVLSVINFLADNASAILGGDVYEYKNNQFTITYDNWYIERNDMTWLAYVEKSREAAMNYVEMYHRQNGDNFCYVIVSNKE